MELRCEACQGTGRITSELPGGVRLADCPRCGGRGHSPIPVEQEVAIEAARLLRDVGAPIQGDVDADGELTATATIDVEPDGESLADALAFVGTAAATLSSLLDRAAAAAHVLEHEALPRLRQALEESLE
jgi:hypothetical protein